MNTLVARHSLARAPAHTTLRRDAARPAPPASASAAAPVAGWIDRLADWAERQPQHRRVGSWVMYR